MAHADTGTGSHLARQLSGIGGSLLMLHDCLSKVQAFLDATLAGTIAPNPAILRDIAGICHLLPTANGPAFQTALNVVCSSFLSLSDLSHFSLILHSK